MAILAKTLANAVSATGAQASVDLGATSSVMYRSLTMQVISSADPASQVLLQGSLDNANWFGMGQVTGTGQLSVDEDVVQYVRAYVNKLASGNVTAYCGFVSG